MVENPIYTIKIIPSDMESLRSLAENLAGECAFLSDNLRERVTLLLADVSLAIIAWGADGGFDAKTQGVQIHGQKAIGEFLKSVASELQEIQQELYSKGEKTVAFMVSNLGTKIYQPWQPLSVNTHDLFEGEADAKEEPASRIVLYKAKSGELAIRFSSDDLCEAFYQKLLSTNGGKPGSVSAEYRRGPQYVHNEQGHTPVRYEGQENRLFFPSYMAVNGEFAVNFACAAIKEKFVELLGIKVSQTVVLQGGIRKMEYSGFFTTYTQPNQLSALYFNQNNPVFTQPGWALQIDTQSGDMASIRIANYSIHYSMEGARHKRAVVGYAAVASQQKDDMPSGAPVPVAAEAKGENVGEIAAVPHEQAKPLAVERMKGGARDPHEIFAGYFKELSQKSSFFSRVRGAVRATIPASALDAFQQNGKFRVAFIVSLAKMNVAYQDTDEGLELTFPNSTVRDKFLNGHPDVTATYKAMLTFYQVGEAEERPAAAAAFG